MTIRSRHRKPKPAATAAQLARSTSLRSIGFTEARCGRTERRVKRPKLSADRRARNRAHNLALSAGHADIAAIILRD